ncbi:MAG: PilZ domain-containing protein [Deltaproteobacteria bacterium]|nr:PilZ domain-containing protein [Deltaproteobacteria bacterium]
MKERREYPRYEIEVPVTLRTNGKLIPAATLDLSLGGISVLTDFNEEIAEGDVEIVMDLSNELKDISIRGNILRFKKGIAQKVAIQFVPDASKGFRHLENFLVSRYN